MGLTPTQEAVLDDLVATIPAEAPWAIIGSVDSVLRGLEADPNDVDLLASETAADALRDAFAEAFEGTRDVGDSIIDEYRIRGEEVEVIYPHAGGDDWLVDFEGVELGESRVPMLPVGDVVEVYREIGKKEAAERLVMGFGG